MDTAICENKLGCSAGKLREIVRPTFSVLSFPFLMSAATIESLASLLNEATAKVAALQNEMQIEPVPKLQSEWLLGKNPSIGEMKEVVRKVMAALFPNAILKRKEEKEMCFISVGDAESLWISFDSLTIFATPSHGCFGLLPGFLRGLLQPPEQRSLPMLVAYFEMFPAYIQWARKYIAFQARILALEQDLLCGRDLQRALPSSKLVNDKRPREVDENNEDDEREGKRARIDEDEEDF